jgi:hypothetical protein
MHPSDQLSFKTFTVQALVDEGEQQGIYGTQEVADRRMSIARERAQLEQTEASLRWCTLLLSAAQATMAPPVEATHVPMGAFKEELSSNVLDKSGSANSSF